MAVLLHPFFGPLILACIMFVMFQAVFAWSAAPVEWIAEGVAWLSALVSSALPPGLHAVAAGRRRDCRRRRGHHFPAADPDPVLLHPAARRHRLHGPRRLPDGPGDARRRPVGPGVHSVAVELRLRGAGDHGDPHHRRPQGPADHDPGRAADDLLGAAAGLHVDHRRLHPRRAPSAAGSACKGW